VSGRKRPRLFSFGREIELANLDTWVEDADQRALLEAVVDAFIEITRTRKLADDTLAPIVTAASHSIENVRAIGIIRLVVMSHYFPDARTAFTELALHEDQGVRLYACASLGGAPEQLLPEMLHTFLSDTSWEVRKSAGQVCTTMQDDELLALVNHQLTVERDARVRVVLELAKRFQQGVRP